MNKKNDLMSLFFITAAASLISAAMRITMTLLYLDTDYGVYKSSSIPTITHIITFLLCLIPMLIGLIKAKEYQIPVAPKLTSATAFASCVTAFLISATTLLSLYNIVAAGQPTDKFTVLKMIASIPAIIYFLALIKNELKPSPALAVTSYFPTIWLALVLLEAYFDQTILITSPAKVFHMLSMLGLMIYLLAESRFILGTSNGSLFFAAGAVAPILAITANLPSMLMADKLLIGESDNYLICAVELAMSLFVLTRTYAYAKSPQTLQKNEIEESQNITKDNK